MRYKGISSSEYSSSIYIAGNLSGVSESAGEESDEDEFYSNSNDKKSFEESDVASISMAEVEAAEEIIYGKVGVQNVFKKFAYFITSDTFDSADLVVQCLVYKIQSMFNGPKV